MGGGGSGESGRPQRVLALLVSAVKSKHTHESGQWLSSAHFEALALIKFMCHFQRPMFSLVLDHACIISLFKLCLMLNQILPVDLSTTM